MRSLYFVGNPSIDDLNDAKSANVRFDNASFFTNFHTRSIRFRFGEYGGKYARSTFCHAAIDFAGAVCWYRALSHTTPIGPTGCASRSLSSSRQNVISVTLPSVDSRIGVRDSASNAPSTPYR